MKFCYIKFQFGHIRFVISESVILKSVISKGPSPIEGQNMCDIRRYGRVSCPRDDLISTLANLSPQLFRGHPTVRNSLIDWGDPPSSLETKVGDSPSIGELWPCRGSHRPSRQVGVRKRRNSPVKPATTNPFRHHHVELLEHRARGGPPPQLIPGR